MAIVTMIAGLFVVETSHAQTAQVPPPADTASGGVRYAAAFFATFNPRTALDIVNQIPGFVLVIIEGPDTRRGFAEAVGNILIDGQRPSAKSQTLKDILQRIPASRVAFVEVLRGAQVAGDASGQALIANVVLRPSRGQASWSAGFESAGRGLAPNGNLSWSGESGPTRYSLGASTFSLRRDLPDTRQVRDRSDAEVELHAATSPREFAEYAVNGDVARQMFGGRLELTGQASRSRYHDDTSVISNSSSGDRLENQNTLYTEWKKAVETGITFRRNAGAWDATLLGLLTRSRFRSDVMDSHRVHSSSGDPVDSLYMQALSRDSGETIVRATLSHRSLSHHLQTGVELAVNSLTAQMDLTANTGGNTFPIHVPNANVRVNERRGEAFVSQTWRPDGRWPVEVGVTAEMSRLHVVGDADRSVTLLYWKPSAQIGRSFGGRNQFLVRAFRDVGQLNFAEFASAASLADRLLNGGNPDLRPQTSWRGEVGVDLRPGARQVAVGITAFHARLRDVADFVPLAASGEQIDARGNIDRGKISGVTFTVRLPLQQIIPGGSLTTTATLQKSAVTDSVTGRSRKISGFQDLEAKTEFREDLPGRQFAWGITHATASTIADFRLREIDRRRASPSLDVFAEAKIAGNLKVRVTALSILGSPEKRERSFFVPDRTGSISRIERRQRWPGHRWIVTVSR